MDEKMNGKKKGVKHMAVSKAIVPTLTGEVAKTFMKEISGAKIKPYSEQSRQKALKSIETILLSRKK